MVEFAPYTREEFLEITRERGNLYERARNATPERKAYKKSQDKARQSTPEYKAHYKEYDKARRATPEHKAYHKEYDKARHARKKLEAQK
jgi:hypothetical protein